MCLTLQSHPMQHTPTYNVHEMRDGWRVEEGYYTFLDEHLPAEFTRTHSAHLPDESETEIGVAILCLPNQFFTGTWNP